MNPTIAFTSSSRLRRAKPASLFAAERENKKVPVSPLPPIRSPERHNEGANYLTPQTRDDEETRQFTTPCTPDQRLDTADQRLDTASMQPTVLFGKKDRKGTLTVSATKGKEYELTMVDPKKKTQPCALKAAKVERAFPLKLLGLVLGWYPKFVIMDHAGVDIATVTVSKNGGGAMVMEIRDQRRKTIGLVVYKSPSKEYNPLTKLCNSASKRSKQWFPRFWALLRDEEEQDNEDGDDKPFKRLLYIQHQHDNCNDVTANRLLHSASTGIPKKSTSWYASSGEKIKQLPMEVTECGISVSDVMQLEKVDGDDGVYHVHSSSHHFDDLRVLAFSIAGLQLQDKTLRFRGYFLVVIMFALQWIGNGLTSMALNYGQLYASYAAAWVVSDTDGVAVGSHTDDNDLPLS